jgi:hypothetical protein
MTLSALASLSAACRSLSASAFVLDRAAADHLGQDPEAVTWAAAEHAARLARQVEALVAEIQSFGGAR